VALKIKIASDDKIRKKQKISRMHTETGLFLIKENRTFHKRETKKPGMYTYILWSVVYSYQHKQQVDRMLENIQIKQ
jgi:hypothetical protein